VRRKSHVVKVAGRQRRRRRALAVAKAEAPAERAGEAQLLEPLALLFGHFPGGELGALAGVHVCVLFFVVAASAGVPTIRWCRPRQQRARERSR
jgi:hypothetical protein